MLIYCVKLDHTLYSINHSILMKCMIRFNGIDFYEFSMFIRLWSDWCPLPEQRKAFFMHSIRRSTAIQTFTIQYCLIFHLSHHLPSSLSLLSHAAPFSPSHFVLILFPSPDYSVWDFSVNVGEVSGQWQATVAEDPGCGGPTLILQPTQPTQVIKYSYRII